MSRAKRQLAATYSYRDAGGNVVYELRRYRPKDFQWVAKSGRAWGKRLRRSLLYRLPELLAADLDQPVYIVEGEKDVDRLWQEGLVATCNDGGGGRGKWRRSHSTPLCGRPVIIIPDNDATGEEHAQDVAMRLSPLAASVRVVALPRLPRKGDVSDWLDKGGTAQKLAELCAAAAPWTPMPASFNLSTDYNELCDFASALQRIIPAPLSPVEKLALIIIKGSRGTASQQTLATFLDLSLRRIRQLVADLEQRGQLRVYRHGRRNTYCIR